MGDRLRATGYGLQPETVPESLAVARRLLPVAFETSLAVARSLSPVAFSGAELPRLAVWRSLRPTYVSRSTRLCRRCFCIGVSDPGPCRDPAPQRRLERGRNGRARHRCASAGSAQGANRRLDCSRCAWNRVLALIACVDSGAAAVRAADTRARLHGLGVRPDAASGRTPLIAQLIREMHAARRTRTRTGRVALRTHAHAGLDLIVHHARDRELRTRGGRLP